jgi:hypothetical protein
MLNDGLSITNFYGIISAGSSRLTQSIPSCSGFQRVVGSVIIDGHMQPHGNNGKEMFQERADRYSQFIMLGLIHGDTEGMGILARSLERLRPDVITLEFSRYGLHFRQVNGDHLKKRLRDTVRLMGLDVGDHQCPPPLRSLFSYLSLPYEFTVASDYSRRTGISLHLVDADLFSWLRLRDIDKVVGRDNLEILMGSPEDSTPETAREKVLAELFFERGIKTSLYTDEMHIRDSLMKDRISLLVRHHGPGRFLHLCGWRHLCDPHDVFGPLKPIKVFMYDRAFRI